VKGEKITGGGREEKVLRPVLGKVKNKGTLTVVWYIFLNHREGKSEGWMGGVNQKPSNTRVWRTGDLRNKEAPAGRGYKKGCTGKWRGVNLKENEGGGGGDSRTQIGGVRGGGGEKRERTLRRGWGNCSTGRVEFTKRRG